MLRVPGDVVECREDSRMNVLRVLSRHGDDRFEWSVDAVRTQDPEAVAAVAAAERIFREERARGAVGLRLAPGRPAERIEEIDPATQPIAMVPRRIGGSAGGAGMSTGVPARRFLVI